MVNYPAQIDNILSLPPAADGATSVSASVVNRLREAIIATQTELGVKPSGTYTTVRNRLDYLEGQVITLGGDIGGTNTNPLVIGIQGRPVVSTAPNFGQGLVWNGSAWEPTNVDTDLSSVVGGSNTQVQFNDDGYLGGDAGLTYNKTTNVLSVSDALAIGASPAASGFVRFPYGGVSALDLISVKDFSAADFALLQWGPAHATTLSSPGSTRINGPTKIELVSTSGNVDVYAQTGHTFYNYAQAAYVLEISGASGDHIDLGAIPASAGNIRFAKGSTVKYRNNANSGNITVFAIGASNDALLIGQNEAGTEQSTATAIAGGYVTLAAGSTQTAQLGATSGDFIALGANTATSGVIRLANDVFIKARNNVNSGDYSLLGINSTGNALLVGSDSGGAGIPPNTILYGQDSVRVYHNAHAEYKLWLGGDTDLDMIALGTIPASVGNIRLVQDFTIVARNDSDTEDLGVLTTYNAGDGYQELSLGTFGPDSDNANTYDRLSLCANDFAYFWLNNEHTPLSVGKTIDGAAWGTFVPSGGYNLAIIGNNNTFNGDDFGGGKGVVYLGDGYVNPTTNPSSGIIIYSDSGVLKYRQPDGTIITLDGVGGATPGGSDTQVQFNDDGYFGGDAGLTYNKTSNVLSISEALAIGASPATTGHLRLPANGTIYGVSAGAGDARLLRYNATGSGYELVIGESSLVGTITLDTTNAPGGGVLITANGTERAFIGASSSDHIDLGASPASSGHLRLPTGAVIRARNNANNDNISILEKSGDGIVFGGTGVTGLSFCGQVIYLKNDTAGTTFAQLSGGSGDYLSLGANPASAGAIRLSNAQTVYGRNNANSGDLPLLATNSSDEILLGTDSAYSSQAARARVYGSGGGALGQGSDTYVGWGTAIAGAGLVTIPQGALSIGSTAASAGAIRLANNVAINARNQANTLDVNLIGLDTANQTVVGDPSSGVLFLRSSIGINASAPYLSVGTGTVASTGAMRVAGGFNIQSYVGGVDRPVLQATTGAEVLIGGFGVNECNGIINRISSGAIYNQIAGNNHLTIAASGVTVGADGVGEMLAIGNVASTAGTIRLETGAIIRARNAANNANITLAETDANDYLYIGSDSTLNANRAAIVYVLPEIRGYLGAGGNAVVQFDGSNGLVLQNNLPLLAPGSSYIGVGGTPATVGAIRFANNLSIYARNQSNIANYRLIGSDTSNNVLVGDGTNATVTLNALNNVSIEKGGTEIAEIGRTGNDYLSLGQFPASNGFLRLANGIGVMARNQANTQDILLLQTDSGNVITIGNTQSASMTIQSSTSIETRATDFYVLSQNGATIYARIGASSNDVVKLGANPATVGTIRLGNDHSIYGRNPANSLNYQLVNLDSSNVAVYGDESSGYGSLKIDHANGGLSLRYWNGSTYAAQFVGDGTKVYTDMVPMGRFVDPATCGHRLSSTTGVAIPTSDVATTTTIYFVPYKSDRIALYDGTRWVERHTSNAQISLALGTLTSGKNYDVFAYDNAGTVTLEFSAAWTNDTTRADTLTTIDGVLVKSGATTRKYVGTIRTISTTQTTDTFAQRFVWNHYNRVRIPLTKLMATDSWSYTTASFRQWNADTSMKVEYVCGDVTSIHVTCQGMASSATGGVGCAVGIGIDSTTVNGATLNSNSMTNANDYVFPRSEYFGIPATGYHALNALENGGTGQTRYGDAGTPTVFQSGIYGWFLG